LIIGIGGAVAAGFKLHPRNGIWNVFANPHPFSDFTGRFLRYGIAIRRIDPPAATIFRGAEGLMWLGKKQVVRFVD
jgi:hypothetical protein